MWTTGGCKHEVASHGLELDPLFDGGAPRSVYAASIACGGIAKPGVGYCEYDVSRNRRYFDHFLVLAWTRDGIVRLFRLHVRGETTATFEGMRIFQRDVSRVEFELITREAVRGVARDQQVYCDEV